MASTEFVRFVHSAEHPVSSVGDDLEQLDALLSGDDPVQGFYGGFGGGSHRPRGASSALGSVTDDLEQLNALLTTDDPPVSRYQNKTLDVTQTLNLVPAQMCVWCSASARYHKVQVFRLCDHFCGWPASLRTCIGSHV